MSENYNIGDMINEARPQAAPIITSNGDIPHSFAAALEKIDELHDYQVRNRETMLALYDEQIATTMQLYEYVDKLREVKSQ